MGSDIQDPFATGAPDADPFAGTAPAPASAIDPPDDEATPPPPVVNREGEPVESQGGNGETPVEPQPAAEQAATPAEAPAEPQAAEEPQEGAQAAVEAPEAPAPETAPASGDGGQPPQPPDAPPATDDADNAEAAATPDEGKSPWRHYMLLYQTGEQQWTEYDLSTVSAELKQYTELKDVDDKGNKALFLRARNADHARRIAWIIFGRPEGGVTVNPVARSSWKPKRLSKAPPQPERERLVIS